jgi:hypothetical protein
MKRCPECYEAYENTDKFCEADGQVLLADPALSAIDNDESAASEIPVRVNQGPWLTGLAGAMVGIALCAGVYAIYSFWIMQSTPDVPQTPAYVSRMQGAARPSRTAQAVIPEINPQAEESPSPEVEASPESTASPAATETQTVTARLNDGPVSTGKALKQGEEGTTVRTIIEMKDGTSVEVDAAWEDRQGIWYRRGAVVSFVESGRVKAITARAEPKAMPASSQ